MNIKQIYMFFFTANCLSSIAWGCRPLFKNPKKAMAEPNKSHIRHYEMRFCACFTSTSTSFATIVDWRNERQTTAFISFLQCVGFRRGPFVKITTALLHHPASPGLRFLENHLMSVSDSGGGPGNGNWFHIALSSQFLIKCNMFRQHKTIFFSFAPHGLFDSKTSMFSVQ